MGVLFHYTCDHGREGIMRDGFVRPWKQILFDFTPLAWFTDVATIIDPVALGLQSTILTCDRTSWRFKVTDQSGILSYYVWRAMNPQWRDRFGDLEEFGKPASWFVSSRPIPVVAS